MALNLEQVYDTIDKMAEMKRYKGPTPGYFPTVAELNTYSKSDLPHMIPYFLWLDSCLSTSSIPEHKEAIQTLQNIITEMEEKGEIING